MNEACRITVETEPRATDINAITLGLLAYNSEKTGGARFEYLVLTVRDENGEVAGGLVAVVYLSWLHIQALWLKEELRGQGYGDSLLAMAEHEGIKRGCDNACLEKFNFQAQPFYEKRGYVTYAELADYPPGGKKYFLSKSLKAQ